MQNDLSRSNQRTDPVDDLFVPVFMLTGLAGILWIVFEVVILILG
jgi:hypothetical protein